MSSRVKKSGAAWGPSVTPISQWWSQARAVLDAHRDRIRHRSQAGSQDVARDECPAAVAAEAAQIERRCASEVVRHIQPSADRDVRAQSVAARQADREPASRRHSDRLPLRHDLAVEGDLGLGARDAHDGLGGERRGSGRCRVASSAGASAVVPDGSVGRTEGHSVHGSRRRNADTPVADTTGQVLHGREKTRERAPRCAGQGRACGRACRCRARGRAPHRRRRSRAASRWS